MCIALCLRWPVAITNSTPAQIYGVAAPAGTNVILAPYPAGFTAASTAPAMFPLVAASRVPAFEYSIYLRVRNVPST